MIRQRNIRSVDRLSQGTKRRRYFSILMVIHTRLVEIYHDPHPINLAGQEANLIRFANAHRIASPLSFPGEPDPISTVAQDDFLAGSALQARDLRS